MLLHSPDIAGFAEPLARYIRYESTLAPALRELATITTSRELDCDYMWFAHARYAREQGVAEETIEVVGKSAFSYR